VREFERIEYYLYEALKRESNTILAIYFMVKLNHAKKINR
jgi:hypothetical protein